MHLRIKIFKNPRVFMLLLLTALGGGIIFSAALGSASISFSNIVKTLVSPIYSSLENPVPDVFRVIIFKVRLPRIILSVIVGMGLSVGGTVFQGIFRNPMANPYILGVSSGAAFGVAVGAALGIQTSFLGLGTVPVSAFTGGIVTALAVYIISGNGRSVFSLLLSGVAMGFFLAALMSLVMYLHRDQLENIVYWSMGSFNAASWTKIAISAPVILGGSAILMVFARDLNILSLGDDTAGSLGIGVKSKRLFFLVISTIITASAVSVSGVIGFVGLVIPHIIRLLSGPDHKSLIPLSMAAGGVFLLFSDTLARTVLSPTELPVGIVTSVFGAPFFIYLLNRHRRDFL